MRPCLEVPYTGLGDPTVGTYEHPHLVLQVLTRDNPPDRLLLFLFRNSVPQSSSIEGHRFFSRPCWEHTSSCFSAQDSAENMLACHVGVRPIRHLILHLNEALIHRKTITVAL